MSLMGIDIGTSGARAVVFDAELRELATSSVALTERGRGPVAELDPGDVLAAVRSVILAVNAADAVRADPVTALAVTPLGEATVAVDGDGNPLDGIPLAADRRGLTQLVELTGRIPADHLRALTGQPVHPMFTVVTWMWWRQHASWWPQVRGLRCVGDYVNERLTAVAAIDRTMASRTLAFDTGTGAWSAEILAAAGIDVPLPEPVAAGSPIGTVLPSLAAELGFHGEPLVVAGAHDQACAAFGAGATTDTPVLSLGTTECLTTPWTGRPAELIDRDYAAYPVDDSGRWLTLAGIPAGGSALRWLARLTGHGEDVQALAASVTDHPEPSHVLVQPHFLGSGTIENDERSRGAVLGIGLDTTAADLVLALWESSGFEVARSLAVLAQARGSSVRELRVVGGGSVSERGLRARSDASGVTVVHVPGPATARGAAILAGVGAGRWARPEDAAPLLVTGARVRPEPTFAEYFAQRRAQHDAIYPALAGLDLTQPSTAPILTHVELEGK